jgi:hypothetical protein
MITKIIEVTNGPQNWGKFLVGRFDAEEWTRRSRVIEKSEPALAHIPLLHHIGQDHRQLLVLDLQTCEGAMFLPGGFPKADLEKHKIWICPMFEPFLEWLYKQDLSVLDKLPDHIDLPDAPFAFSGYRREGKSE